MLKNTLCISGYYIPMIAFIYDFDKNATHSGERHKDSSTVKFCFATTGVCVFYASASVGAFFIIR